MGKQIQEVTQQFNTKEYITDSKDEPIMLSFQFFNRSYKLVKKIMRQDSDNDHIMLIDTGSTFSVIRNKNMLINIHDSDITIRAVTNGRGSRP